MGLQNQKELEERYVMSTFARKPVCLVKGEGMHVYEMAAADETKPVILYLHGGAYRQGITPSHWKILSEISKATGCGFVMPDYFVSASCFATLSNDVEPADFFASMQARTLILS